MAYKTVYQVDIYFGAPNNTHYYCFTHRNSYHHWRHEVLTPYCCLPNNQQIAQYYTWLKKTWGAEEALGDGLYGPSKIWLEFENEEQADRYFEFYHEKDMEHWEEKNNRSRKSHDFDPCLECSNNC
jgi:hypothetical protein